MRQQVGIVNGIGDEIGNGNRNVCVMVCVCTCRGFGWWGALLVLLR